MLLVEEKGDSSLEIGSLISVRDLRRENTRVKKNGGTEAKARPARPAQWEPILLGITQAALTTESFLSAASFQETTRVLTDASIERKRDNLNGLKENIIMGHIIPAGTGLKKFRSIVVKNRENEWLPVADLANEFDEPAPVIEEPEVS